MSETKQTPTPWKLSIFGLYADDMPERIQFVVRREEWTRVALVAAPDYLESKANAEFIVRACNSHDDLLAACKAMLEDLKADPRAQGYDSVAIAEAVIAKAEGMQA